MPVDLEELERLLAEATPGPWRVRYSNGGGDARCGLIVARETAHRDREVLDVGEVGDQRMENDLDAIAALRNAAPALLAELRACLALLVAAQADAATWRDRCEASFEDVASLQGCLERATADAAALREGLREACDAMAPIVAAYQAAATNARQRAAAFEGGESSFSCLQTAQGKLAVAQDRCIRFMYGEAPSLVARLHALAKGEER